jgi:hypothetical protein
MLKKELAGVTMTPEEFRKERGRLHRRIPKEEFTRAFVRWQEACEQCIRIGSRCVKKSQKINIPLTLII